MACRLYMELRLGLFADPITDGAISKVVFKNIGIIHQQHSGDTSELRSLDDEDVDTDSGRQRGDWVDEEDLSYDGIELADIGSRRHDF
jgi:hypothetical protein